MKKQISIKDVAQEAHVSTATVSRILNGVEYPVSDKLRARVMDAIDLLGYVPNRMAQNLRSGQVSAIGLLVRDIGDPYFSSIAKGVTEEAGALGLMPLICSSKRNPDREIELLHFLAQYQVAGIILAGAGWRTERIASRMERAIRQIEKAGVKVVACAPQGIALPSALVENDDMGRKAFEQLYSLGHRHIEIIGGDASNLSAHLRAEGFLREAEAARGVEITRSTARSGEFTWRHGFDAAQEAMRSRPETTAIFCVNDNIAVGALSGLSSMGYNLPGDVSVVGVGDIDVAQYTNPPLSTFRIPFARLGAAGVRLILDATTKSDTAYIFESAYVERGSVSSPRPGSAKNS